MQSTTNISPDAVSNRIKEINKQTPLLWTNIVKSPQELTVRTTAMNNIMLEDVLKNQNEIMKNQNEIMKNMGLGKQLNAHG